VGCENNEHEDNTQAFKLVEGSTCTSHCDITVTQETTCDKYSRKSNKWACLYSQWSTYHSLWSDELLLKDAFCSCLLLFLFGRKKVKIRQKRGWIHSSLFLPSPSPVFKPFFFLFLSLASFFPPKLPASPRVYPSHIIPYKWKTSGFGRLQAELDNQSMCPPFIDGLPLSQFTRFATSRLTSPTKYMRLDLTMLLILPPICFHFAPRPYIWTPGGRRCVDFFLRPVGV